MKRFLAIILSIVLLVGNVSVLHTTYAQSVENLQYTLKTIDGRSVTTKAQTGKCKILIFGTTTCMNCQQTIYNLSRNENILSNKIEVIFGMSTPDIEEAKSFAEAYGRDGITFCYDANSVMWNYASAVGYRNGFTTPLIIFVEEDNQIRKVLTGNQKAETIMENAEDIIGILNPECVSYSGNNIGTQDYSVHTETVKSYLAECDDGTLMRVQYDKMNDGSVLAEYYDSDYNITNAKLIPQELPVFGGFYATDSNYFIVSGQENPNESDRVEVIRITKYDKNWKRISCTGLYGANTVNPFWSGAVRMDNYGKYLLIRTCHRMYQAEDGKNHQANITIEVDTENMKVTDSHTDVANTNLGYVSHSFNQFIKIDNKNIVAVDHGDAYPRSIVLLKYKTDVSTGLFVPDYFRNPCDVVDVLSIPGNLGANATGASVGGLEISGSNYLVVGNSVVQDANNLSRTTRNIYVAAVNKSTSKVTMNWITSYDEGDGTTSTPQFVKVSDNRFIVLWTRDGKVYYTEVNGSGKKVGETYNVDGDLSDCQPIIKDGKVIWYAWKNSKIDFYEISLSDLSECSNKERKIGHNYENLGISNGVASLRCSICGDEKQVRIIEAMNVLWNATETGTYSTGFIREHSLGTKLYCWVKAYDEVDNYEIEIISSDESVARVTSEWANRNDTMATISIIGVGDTMITVRPKYNPEYSRNYYIHVQQDLKVQYFYTDYSWFTPSFGQEIELFALGAGGYGTLQYKFYEKLSDGTANIIRDYSANNTYKWRPSSAGEITICVEIKDENGTVVTGELEDFTINKAEALLIGDIEKNYCYDTGAKNQNVNISEVLPEDKGDSQYKTEIYDPYRILSNVSIDAQGILRYSVKDTGNLYDRAVITVKVASKNYKDMEAAVNILLVDKQQVELDGESSSVVKSGSSITYGQRLKELAFDTDNVKFVDGNGDKVSGTLQWSYPEEMPDAGTLSAEWEFIPDSPAYANYTGTSEITVKKAIPDVTKPTVEAVSYIPNQKLDDIEINGEDASYMVGGEKTEVYGAWKWEKPNTPLDIGKKTYTVEFVPYDTSNYKSVQQEIAVEVKKTTPYIASTPYPSEITYGELLSASELSGGEAQVGIYSVSGTFSWKDGSIKPSVADSYETEYMVLFTPDDSEHYNTIECKLYLAVERAENAPNMPRESMSVSNSITKVADVPLPDGWSWDEDDLDMELSTEWEVYAIAYYEDQENYYNDSIIIGLRRSDCEHVEGEIIVDLEPTCTMEGYGHTECTVCGEIVRDYVEIPIIAHNYTDWKKADNSTHIGTCDACGDTVKENHIWDSGKITKQPTTSATGVKTYTCTICKATKTEIVAKLKATTSNSTNSSTVSSMAKKPAKVKLKKPKNLKGKKVKLTWKKVANAAGYDIIYATNKKFTQNVGYEFCGKKATSKTIKYLKKKKTYYFKIRAYSYKTDDLYGSWSKVKKVKIKK